jgi:hypothetical protein
MREVGAAGKLPFLKHIELKNSENVVSQFLPILVRTTTGAVNNKPLTIIPGNDIPKPTAPEVPAVAQVSKEPPCTCVLGNGVSYVIISRDAEIPDNLGLS